MYTPTNADVFSSLLQVKKKCAPKILSRTRFWLFAFHLIFRNAQLFCSFGENEVGDFSFGPMVLYYQRDCILRLTANEKRWSLCLKIVLIPSVLILTFLRNVWNVQCSKQNGCVNSFCVILTANISDFFSLVFHLLCKYFLWKSIG